MTDSLALPIIGAKNTEGNYSSDKKARRG